MKLLVGLGNPGPQYTNTRHNAGFMVVDRLLRSHAPGSSVQGRFKSACVEGEIAGEKCFFIKPTTFMNLSGQAVGEAVRFYKINPASDLLVIVDDIYLDVGQVRLKPGGGAGGHNGLADIQRQLGGDAFPRLRIGVGAKPAFMDQADWVLSRFTETERGELDSAIERAVKAAETFVTRGLDAAMNQTNAGERPPREPKPEGILPVRPGDKSEHTKSTTPEKGLNA